MASKNCHSADQTVGLEAVEVIACRSCALGRNAKGLRTSAIASGSDVVKDIMTEVRFVGSSGGLDDDLTLGGTDYCQHRISIGKRDEEETTPRH